MLILYVANLAVWSGLFIFVLVLIADVGGSAGRQRLSRHHQAWQDPAGQAHGKAASASGAAMGFDGRMG